MKSLITVGLALFAVSFVTRVFPLFFSRWFQKQKWMQRVGDTLPMMTLFLLVFHDGEGRVAQTPNSFLAIVIGLLATLIMHHMMRKTALSLAIGVIFYALSLSFF